MVLQIHQVVVVVPNVFLWALKFLFTFKLLISCQNTTVVDQILFFQSPTYTQHMDVKSLTEIFRETLNPDLRNEAEKKLEVLSEMNGFGSLLLQVVMSNLLELYVRQSAVIYLKNMVCGCWVKKKRDISGCFRLIVQEEDKVMIRDKIVTATMMAPDIIMKQLAVCVLRIIKCDFPQRWSHLVGQVSVYLVTEDPSKWMGSLLCL